MGEKLARLWAAFTSSLGVKRYIIAHLASLALLGYGTARQMLTTWVSLPEIPSWLLWLGVAAAIVIVAILNRVAELEKRAEPKVAVRYQGNPKYVFHKCRDTEETWIYSIGIENLSSVFLPHCRLELIANVNENGKASDFLPATLKLKGGTGDSGAFTLSVKQELLVTFVSYFRGDGESSITVHQSGAVLALPEIEHKLTLRAYAGDGIPVDATFRFFFDESEQFGFERVAS